VKDIVEGYNNTEHRMLKKSPNEITKEDVQKNAQEKRLHNAEVLQDLIEKAEGKTIGILNRKNIFDKGSKIKLSKSSISVDAKRFSHLTHFLSSLITFKSKLSILHPSPKIVSSIKKS